MKSPLMILAAAILSATVPATSGRAQPPDGKADRPNVVVIFCDDMGYGDLGCFGQTRYATPNLDRMAAEGARFTDFYVSSAVCSASRAALLTGAYHERVGIQGALGPKTKVGLSHDETTMAEMFKSAGYATGMAGKWHLGYRPSQAPVHHGFDEFLGLPYSGDMWPHHPERPEGYPKLPLIEGDQPAIADVTAEIQKTLTSRFADRAVDFIKRHKDEPFFFYLAPNMPHVPLFVRDENAGRSGAGLYGDVIREIDDAVGAILSTLRAEGLDERTLVVFTSDNGPWLSYGDHGGSAGPLREGKGTSYEGGVRVPFVARWPGKVPAGLVQRQPAATIDLLPTFAAMIGGHPPALPIDGLDVRPLLFGEPDARSPHEALFFYYGDGELQAMRSGPWKLLFPHATRTMNGQAPGGGGVPGKYRPLAVGLELYDLDADLGETHNLAADRPEVVAQLQGMADSMRARLGDRLTKADGPEIRPAATAAD
ncbi:sulfatase [Planctomyces sp. SH-PL62]|uniref:sulfatase family protein n=1 Tax=Planctomyces sp. SH-PL62 TaxID=1636152 RepID=UPI00078B9982|nr:sulfatase [Planctomyces sp. SH-PL62]AMV38541.1 Arylsulfatase [Planctomyces sp. SH-PL62]